jgi:hypothetical protein
MWMSSLKGVITPRLVDSYWAKAAAIMVCQHKETSDWLAASVPILVAWESSRLKMVGLDALSTYKRVVAWLLGPLEDTERYFQLLRRLNQGLDTRHWTVYEHTEEPNRVRHMLSTDTTSVTAMQEMSC